MALKTFKFSLNFIFYPTFIYLSSVNFIKTAPIDSSISYENFMNDIKRDNCSFPPGVILPFPSLETFEYLSQPLSICKASKEPKHSQEARTLCSEVFDILKDVTCHPNKSQNLPEIRVEFSDDVCQNISSLSSDPSMKNNSLLKHLTDRFICNMMCAEDFQKACRVLLWSHQVQKLIEYLPRVQNVTTTKDGSKTTDVTKGQTPSENTKVDLAKDGKTTLAEKSSSAMQKSDNHPAPDIQTDAPVLDNETDDATKISKSDKETSNNKEFMNPPTLNDNKLGSKRNSSPESNVDQPDQLVKTIKDAKPTKDGKVDDLKDDDVKEKKTDDQIKTEDKSSIPALPSHNVNEKEVLTKNKNETKTPDNAENKVSKNTAETQKETSSTNKITDTTKIDSGKKIDMVEKVKNSTKVDKAEDSSQLKIEAKEKDMTQPAIVPKITNEADEDKAIKQDMGKGKEISDNVLPTVGNIEETTIAEADLENMEEGNGIPEPVDKGQDPYNEDGFYDASKNKKTEEVENRIPKPADIQNELPKYNDFIARNSVGQGLEDIQVIPAFPEQEDSHFFFYFLSLVLILMGGYLLFHNKQKIIALIVEGRHERRRRSHGVGYKKLETK